MKSNVLRIFIFLHQDLLKIGKDDTRSANNAKIAKPLGNHLNVCGVVCITMAVLYHFKQNFFYDYLVSSASSHPRLFLSNPTVYNKYLRQCIMTWVVMKLFKILAPTHNIYTRYLEKKRNYVSKILAF